MLISDFTVCLPGVFFRTKQIKGTPLLQLVDAYRNTEGQPRQRVVASLGNASLPAGDPRRLAKAVEEQINGHSGLLDVALTEDAAAWVVHVASLAKRSKGATQSVGGTVIDGVLLYDVTNTHFEGICAKNPKAKHGKNKQKRNDCRQVAVAMISTAEQRFLKDSGRLQARVSRGRLKRETLIERAIGALLKKHPKVARFYQLTQSGDVRDWQTLRRFAGPWVAGAFHGIT